MKKHILALALASMGAFSAQAQDQVEPAGKQQANVPAALQLAVQGGLKIERQFPAAGGLTGWILVPGSGPKGPSTAMAVFTTPDGEVAISGAMVNAKGENLTRKYLDQYGPKIDYDKAWPKLEKSAFITEGTKKDAKSVIYAFLDPNCGYCHAAWKALQAYEKAGLQIRWIPVAFLRADSANKSAALLTSKDVDATMAAQQASFGQKSAADSTPVTPAIQAKLDANAKLMAELGYRGTPAILYKDKSGKVQSVDGMPRLSQLPTITGLPEQTIDDPDLARFR